MLRSRSTRLGGLGLGVLGSLGSVLLIAAPGAAIAQPTVGIVESGNPKRDALSRLMKPVDIEFKENRLEDVVRVLTDLTGATFEPLWIDDRNANGLDREMPITLRARGASALRVLERVLEKAANEGESGGNTWQLTDFGEVQIGPKSRLNKDRRIEIYDINDLLLVTPDFDNAPEFDLQSTLSNNAAGGGGSSQSPFQQNNQDQTDTTVPRAERAQGIVDLILELVEPDQWVNNGGIDGATIRYFQGSVIVNGPDYIHRQINGYSFWPSANTSVSSVGGRRYLTLNGTVESSNIDGFAEREVTGVVPGGGE